jgi:3-dehydroquinate synthase
MAQFQIKNTHLAADVDPRHGTAGFAVKSVPRPYTVDWLSETSIEEMVESIIGASDHALVYIDRKVKSLHFTSESKIETRPQLVIDASESLKTIEGALQLTEFLDMNGATKSTLLIVIGGGVVQDVAGFACCIYKRGIPWIYIPTTFLAQGDSGMGGKAGLNYKGAKNILALFSAPRRVVIHTGFLSSLLEEDFLSGLGEVYRLHVTGGPEFLSIYEAGYQRYRDGDRSVLNDLLVSALSVKRAVIEEDEFEIDIRRAMNYGHSMGHAFETLTDHAIPHGTAVVLGMLVENEISHSMDLLSSDELVRLRTNAHPLISERVRSLVCGMDTSGILEILGRDKKSEGNVLKLAVLETAGRINFVDLPLVPQTRTMIQKALAEVVSQF